MRALLDNALARRLPLLSADTNSVRLVDGEGDGMPGIELEAFADRWLLATKGPQIPPELDSWLAASGRSVAHKILDQHHKESPRHLHGSPTPESFAIRENGLNYEVSFHSGYSQGIFLDQRERRAELIRRADGWKVLNTFAYTGAFSVAAASAGAETTTLDLSQPYLDWAKRNFALNQLDPASHHFCRGDAFQWLERFARQRRSFDLVILDPPTFSRTGTGKTFSAEKDFSALAALAMRVLTTSGSLLCSTNCRKLTPAAFHRQLREASPTPVRLTPNPMPPDFRGERYLKSVWVEHA